MSEYIDKQKLKTHYAWWQNEEQRDFDAIVDAQPIADVQEVRHGKWLEWDDGEGDTFECSVCGELWTLNAGTPIENNMNYCPNCGAKMDESEGEE